MHFCSGLCSVTAPGCGAWLGYCWHGSLALNCQHKAIQRLCALALGTSVSQGIPAGSAQPHCLCWPSIPTGCPRCPGGLCRPAQAGRVWSSHCRIGWNMILTVCTAEAVLLPKKGLAIWNIKMLTFLYDGGACFWKFLSFPKRSATVPQLIFHPLTLCPLAKDWI